MILSPISATGGVSLYDCIPTYAPTEEGDVRYLAFPSEQSFNENTGTYHYRVMIKVDPITQSQNPVDSAHAIAIDGKAYATAPTGLTEYQAAISIKPINININDQVSMIATSVSRS